MRLTAYSGEAADLSAKVLQDYLDAAASDVSLVPVDRSYPLDLIRDAQDRMEQNLATGKMVVVP